MITLLFPAGHAPGTTEDVKTYPEGRLSMKKKLIEEMSELMLRMTEKQCRIMVAGAREMAGEPLDQDEERDNVVPLRVVNGKPKG